MLTQNIEASNRDEGKDFPCPRVLFVKPRQPVDRVLAGRLAVGTGRANVSEILNFIFADIDPELWKPFE